MQPPDEPWHQGWDKDGQKTQVSTKFIHIVLEIIDPQQI